MIAQDTALHRCRDIADRALSDDEETSMEDLLDMAQAWRELDRAIMSGERLPLAWLDIDVELRRVAKRAKVDR